MLAKMLSGYAEALQELGELEKAEPIAARGVKLSQRVYGESNQFASTLTSHASILASLGRHEEAAAEFKRAIALFELVGGSPVLLQVTRYELAGSLWYQKETRAESVETVKKVRDWFLAKGPNFKDYSDEAEAWLKTHPAK
jgi:tetratricopeptide (TPR) repeat protein